MLKKIFIIGLLTGAAQLFSVFVLKFLSNRIHPEQLKAIGQVDTLIFFIMNILAFGLQSVAIRNIALTDEWQEEYKQTQRARLSAGLLLACLCIFSFINGYYLFFLLAPLLAMSGDYAVYARGHPVFGAFIAFIRVFVPYLLLICFLMYYPGGLGWIYGLGIALTYMITNFFISRYLGVAYISAPKAKSLRLYYDSINLGIVTLSLYFIGQGLILVAPYFYSSVIVAIAFIGLKFYVIYKGMLRILHQAFVNKMIDDDVSLKVDQLSILAGIVFAGSVAIFPETFISIFFGKQFIGEKLYFQLLAFSGLIYSVFLSLSTKSLLLKKDKPYALISVSAAMVSIIVLIISSFFWQTTTNIALSICAGEIFWVIGLIRLTGTSQLVEARMSFLLQSLPILLIPVLIRYTLRDNLVEYVLSFAIVLVLLLILHKKKFQGDY